jgi:AraC-like DNA-binding protein
MAMKPLPQTRFPSLRETPPPASSAIVPDNLYGYHDLIEDLDLLGSDYRLSCEIDDGEPVLQGEAFSVRELQPGLILHCAKVRDLQNFQTRLMQLPGMKLNLLTAGSTEIAYGAQRYRLGPDAGSAGANPAALVALAEPETFLRQWQRDRKERKVSITIKREWLDQTGLAQLNNHGVLSRFAAGHLSDRLWQPSLQALLAAEQILAPPVLLPALQDLWLQSHCLQIVVEALAVVAGDPLRGAPAISPYNRQRLRRLRALLDSGEADEWSMLRIARQVDSNPTTLQRLFRADSGMTIFEYQRHRRLQQAHLVLSRDHVSVEQAAAVAGYANAANFATAFKRRFGITPRAARKLRLRPG